MPLTTTTDTAAVPKVILSKYEIQRNERHAASQVGSDAKRRSRNAPRRDDMARAAYYALLMVFADPKTTPEEKARLRGATSGILKKAGFDRTVSREIFNGHAATVVNDLNGWLAQRWYAEGRRMGDDRGRYVPLKRINKGSEVQAASRPADGSAAD